MTGKASFTPFCLACGRRSDGEFCSDQCAAKGPRQCLDCGDILRRKVTEPCSHFRMRLFCNIECRSRTRSKRIRAAWLDPDQRERFLRGVRLVTSTVEHAERGRRIMTRLWQDPEFAALRKNIGKLTPVQVRAIRADTRSCKKIGQEYNLSESAIAKIRRRDSYIDVE